jgi:hypothetical protein
VCHCRLTSIAGKDRPISSAVKDRNAIVLIPLCLLSFGLWACQAKLASIVPAERPSPAGRPSEADYQAPPSLTSAARQSDGRILLAGLAGPGDRVRLASPDGQAVYADAARNGAWRLAVAAPAAPRLYGLSMTHGDHTVQAEGYLAVTPDGLAAQLRSGAGALVLGDGTEVAISAVDFDSKGGAVVSGRATPRATLDLWVDGERRGRGSAGPNGVFSLALDEPLSFAEHRLEIVDGQKRLDAEPRLSPAARPTGGPYRATQTKSGWRIDWITPGGGLQTTLLPTRAGSAS